MDTDMDMHMHMHMDMHMHMCMCMNMMQAEEFASGVHAAFPEKLLAYNLSPSFNWDAAGMSDEQIEAFTNELGKRGFVWQFITLAGFHANGLITHSFVKGFAER